MTRRLAQQLVLAAFAVALLAAPVATLLPKETVASRANGSFHWARKTSQFTLNVGEQEFFRDRNLSLPWRCKTCRAERKRAQVYQEQARRGW